MNLAHVVGLLLVALPSGQAMTLEVEGPQVPLEPDAVYPMALHVAVSCSAVLAHPALQPRLNVSIEAEGIAVHGHTSTTIDRQDCVGQQQITILFDYQVSALKGTLAGEPIPIQFAAVLEDAEQRATATFEVLVAYVGTFHARALHDHKEAGPQKQIEYGLLVKNLGNAETVFTFSAQRTEQGDLVAPSPVILHAEGHGRSETVVAVIYSTPFANGPNNVREDLRIDIQAASIEGTPGGNATVQLTADTKGFYVPSGAWLPALALGGALLARRRL